MKVPKYEELEAGLRHHFPTVNEFTYAGLTFDIMIYHGTEVSMCLATPSQQALTLTFNTTPRLRGGRKMTADLSLWDSGTPQDRQRLFSDLTDTEELRDGELAPLISLVETSFEALIEFCRLRASVGAQPEKKQTPAEIKAQAADDEARRETARTAARAKLKQFDL
jgi:hypothetical protein